MASSFYLEPTENRRDILTTYFRSLESPRRESPVTTASIDAATYGVLLGYIEQLRPASFLRPVPTDLSDFESAVAARSLVVKHGDDTASSNRKGDPSSVEISSVLHSTLDDIQQILSAGPSSSQDHTHLDEQALGEITAFLQSGPPVVWPENDAARLTNVGNILPVTDAYFLEHGTAVVTNTGPQMSTSSTVDHRSVKPSESLTLQWHHDSASVQSIDGSASSVVCLKRYQCVLCLLAFDVPPSTQRHNSGCGVCAGDVLEVPIYQCRRCSSSYYSESAAQHHALFLCTRDDAGDDIGHALRRYSCSVCHIAFFSAAGLQAHVASQHSDLPSIDAESCTSRMFKTDGLADNFYHQSGIYVQQSGVVQAPVQVHGASSVGNSSPASAEEASLPCRMIESPEPTSVVARVSQTKLRARRRYSGRPPKGIIYKNVFMTSEGLYYCSTCNADLNTVERRAEHRDRPCGRASAASYARHYVFICPHCSSRWSSQKACYEHQISTCLPQVGVNVADLSLRKYACPICNRLHFSLAPLRGHMTTAHRLHRDEVIQRLIAAGYMTPEGANVKLDNAIDIQKTTIMKSSSNSCGSPSSTTAVSESDIIALLNKELNSALIERENGCQSQYFADRKPLPESTEGATTSDFTLPKLNVLAAFPQLPKPVVNLRAVPKIMSAASTTSLATSPYNSSSSPCIGISPTTTSDTKLVVDSEFCNSASELEPAVAQNVDVSCSDQSCISSSPPTVCSTFQELSTSTTNDVSSASDATSSQEIKCEMSVNSSVVSPTSEVTSTAVSPGCQTISDTEAGLEKQSNSCGNGMSVRNGKVKFVLSKSDSDGKSGRQIQLPVVALERTMITEVCPTVGLSSATYSQNSKLRPRQHASVQCSSLNPVRICRRKFGRQRISNLRKSSTVSDGWKASVPVLRIPVSRPNTRSSCGFGYKRNLSSGRRLVDQKLPKKKSLDTKDFVFDCLRGRHRVVTKSRNGRRQFAAVSSGADTAAISTRSQCRQILEHNVVR